MGLITDAASDQGGLSDDTKCLDLIGQGWKLQRITHPISPHIKESVPEPPLLGQIIPCTQATAAALPRFAQ